MLSSLLLTLTQQGRPMFPPTYKMQQTSVCVRESIFCPSLINVSIVSQTYFSAEAQHAAALDTYDLASGNALLVDMTQIYLFNATHLATDLYMMQRGSGKVACNRTLLPAALAPSVFNNDVLGGGSKLVAANVTFDGTQCEKWKSGPLSPPLFWYVDSVDRTFVGFQTLDGSQFGYVSRIEAVSHFDASVWERPPVECVEVPPGGLLARQWTVVLNDDGGSARDAAGVNAQVGLD